MSILQRYIHLLLHDRAGLRLQLWMVYNRYKISATKWLFNRYARVHGIFLTIHRRPVAASQIGTWSLHDANEATTAIVMQGPLVGELNFTLETVRLYKKHYPLSPVIISTWESESATIRTALQAAGAVVVTSTKPPVTGIGNVNLQLVSTLTGMRKAKELGATFVYKTRCDQRAYAPNLNAALRALLTTFPPKAGTTQTHRIIGSSFGTLKHVPYLFTDVFQFGHIDDMLAYWSAPHDPRTTPSKMITTVQDLIDERMCEAYLCSTYLERIGRPLDWTIADWWQACADHFIVVDHAAIDLFFYKYDVYHEHRSRRYEYVGNDAPMTFFDWIQLHRNSAPTPPESWKLLNRMGAVPTITS